MDLQKLTLEIEQEVSINAAAPAVFDRLIHRLTDENIGPNGVAMPMQMERRPGGRWYRDLGGDTGHLWASVQSFRPPDLLEFIGPLFMSAPVAGHLIIRLKEENGVTRLTLRHRAFGLIEDAHRQGVNEGWAHYVQIVKKDFDK